MANVREKMAERENLDDKVAINMLLLPLAGWAFFGIKTALAVAFFYFFNYLFLSKFYFDDEDIRSYKKMSAVWIFLIIYAPLISFLFLIGEFA